MTGNLLQAIVGMFLPNNAAYTAGLEPISVNKMNKGNTQWIKT